MLVYRNGHVTVQRGDAMQRSKLILIPSVAQGGQGPPPSKKEEVCGKKTSLGAGYGLARSNNFGVMAGART